MPKRRGGAQEEMGVNVHVCTHVCVCWGVVPPAGMVNIVPSPNHKTPPGKAKC